MLLQAHAAAKLHEQHKLEASSLRRERSALEKQAAALKTLPSQKERREVRP